MFIREAHVEIKSDSVGFPRTRLLAAKLAMDGRLTAEERLVAWNIAHTPRELAAPDAWTVNRIAGRVML